MKKIIIIVLAAILVIGGALVFIFRGNVNPAGPSQQGEGVASGEQSIGQISGGVPSSEIPAGDTITLGSPSGNVTVSNFYKTALGIIEGSQVVMVQNDQYQIDYSRADSSFAITITKGPVSASRAAAEMQLTSTLGVSRTDACRLSVSVVVPISVDSSLGGRSYPLSFCSGGAFQY